MSNRTIGLHGRIFLSFDIKLESGLHIGGGATAMEIGGLDKTVVRNPITNEPYIPGSSLKGKMRSLIEKASHAPQNYPVNKSAGVYVHVAESMEQYQNLPVSKVFGTLPSWGPEGNHTAFTVGAPTRLIVRDVKLSEDSVKRLDPKRVSTDLPYTEVKWEAAIDRVTSAATPRQIERVPAGAVFGPAEIVYSVYVGENEEAPKVAGWFKHVIEALDYLEDDYLGGMGTRGNGRVTFTNLKLETRRVDANGYAAREEVELGATTVREIDKAALVKALEARFSQE